MENANGKEYDLPSGAKLYVSIGPWGQVKPLHDAVARVLIGSGISPAEVAALVRVARTKLGDVAAKPTDDEQLTILSVLARKALEVGGSKELEDAIFACMEKCIYRPDENLNFQFKVGAPGYGVFDQPSCRDRARGDYYEICMAVVEENLRPFGQALFSMFMAHAGKRADTRESNTAKEQTKQP